MREFTKKELAQYNGRRGLPILIAYQGQVFDVSASYQWKGGRRQVLHLAGIDLPDCFSQAPHGADVLSKFPIIGQLIED